MKEHKETEAQMKASTNCWTGGYTFTYNLVVKGHHMPHRGIMGVALRSKQLGAVGSRPCSIKKVGCLLVVAGGGHWLV